MSGCVGFNIPQPIQSKPYTLFSKGDQFGRDQLANRLMVANGKALVKGVSGNDLLSLLGQPQQIQVLERNISEDWYFVYYKKYIPYNPVNKMNFPDEEGEFVVRIYRDKVIDLVKLD